MAQSELITVRTSQKSSKSRLPATNFGQAVKWKTSKLVFQPLQVMARQHKHLVISSDLDLDADSSFAHVPVKSRLAHDLTQLGQETTIRSSGRNGGRLQVYINVLQIHCLHPLAVTVQGKDYRN